MLVEPSNTNGQEKRAIAPLDYLVLQQLLYFFNYLIHHFHIH